MVYEKAKADLMERFKGPAHSKKDVDDWSWPDNSLVILQEDPTKVRIGFSNGNLRVLNQREGREKGMGL